MVKGATVHATRPTPGRRFERCRAALVSLSKGDEVSATAQLHLEKVQASYFKPDQVFALWDAIRRPVLRYFSLRRLK
jgi:hypothetical protein